MKTALLLPNTASTRGQTSDQVSGAVNDRSLTAQLYRRGKKDRTKCRPGLGSKGKKAKRKEAVVSARKITRK
jgi:hypothetical protein